MDRKLPLLGAALLATAALATAWWVFSVDTEPDVLVSAPVASSAGDEVPLPATRSAPREPRARPDRRRPPRERRAAPAPPEPGEPPPELRDWELPPDERALARNEFRLERQAELAERLEQHALDAGWDAQTTDAVQDVLLATTDRISDALDRVDRGEVPWDQVRDEMRDFRIDQARDVREILGPEAFDAWVVDMGFERFPDEGPPVHGRLDEPARRPPKRPRRPAP
jgi:hypothetical protein